MRLYSRKEAAELLGIGLTTLDALRETGRIGFYQRRPGCKVQFTQVHIDQYLQQVEQMPRKGVQRGKWRRGKVMEP